MSVMLWIVGKILFKLVAALAAPAAAIVAVAGLAFKWHLDRLNNKEEKRDRRRVAFTRFYLDMHLRRKYLAKLDVKEAKASRIQVLERHAHQGIKFRFYGAQVTDTIGQELVSNQLRTIDAADALRIRDFIRIDRLFVVQYEKLQTAEFEALSVDRQISALTDWINTAEELAAEGNLLELLIRSEKYRDLKLGEAQDALDRPNNGTSHDILHDGT